MRIVFRRCLAAALCAGMGVWGSAAAGELAAQVPTDPDTPPDSLGAAAPDPVGPDTLEVPEDTFVDARARELFVRARERWYQADSSLLSYDAVSRMRVGAYLRTPLRDRTLFESEAASRVHWSADSTVVVQALGSTGRTVAGPLPLGAIPFDDSVFDPTADRVTFGLTMVPDPDGDADAEDEEPDDPADGADVDVDGEEASIEVGFQHPIAPGAENSYRYQTGDSLTLSLPDGRSIRTVSLELIPRERSGRLLSGEVWIEPESGAVVRALYRLATEFDVQAELDVGAFEMSLVPGMLQPIEFDVSLVVIDYTLWDFEHWMPGRFRLEGYMRAGVIRAPFQLDQSYRILDVVDTGDRPEPEPPEAVVQRWLTDGTYGDDWIALGPDEIRDPENPYDLSEDDDPDAPEDAGDDPEDAADEDEDEDEDADADQGDEPRLYLIIPEDPEDLRTSDLLPPPIGGDAPGFATRDELDSFLRELEDLPVPGSQRNRFSYRLGPELGELTRYNRVEGLALGALGSWSTVTGVGQVGADLRGWIGIGSGEPDVRLDLYRESAFYRVVLSGYHRIDTVEPLDGALGIGNSASALLWGNDSGEYFRATGARLRLEPLGVRRPWWVMTVSAEEHASLPQSVDFTVAGLLGGDDTPFGPNLEADEGREYAAALELSPWWGTDPSGVQGGVSLLLHGAGGDYEWFRSRMVGRLSTPLGLGVRTGLELGVGRVWGGPPIQRHWHLGGARTLRGYSASLVRGTDFARARVEFSRQTPVARLSLFSDAGWAGPRDAFHWDEVLYSAGIGVSIMDGLMRLDLARALKAPTGWSLQGQVDAAF